MSIPIPHSIDFATYLNQTLKIHGNHRPNTPESITLPFSKIVLKRWTASGSL